MYDGLIDGYLINKMNILVVMIVMYSIDLDYVILNYYQYCFFNQVGYCLLIEVLIFIVQFVDIFFF